MMRSWARAVAPLLLLLTASTALAQPPQILLVKGRIAEAEYLDGLLTAKRDNNAPFVDGSNYRIKLTITEVLIGQSLQKDLYLSLTITDAPPDDLHPEIFLLAKQGAGGQFETIDWDYAANGVCISDVTAHKYGIEKAARAAAKKYPCK